MRSHRLLSFASLAAVTTLGAAGCVTEQPWQLPNPYGYGSSGSSAPYYSGGTYGYGSPYNYGYYSDPYYYRQTYVLPYPAYGYIPYPGYSGHYCRDNDRDGRCDYRERQDRDDDDRDHDHDGDHDGHHDRDRDHDGDVDHGGSQPRLGRAPFDEVRRIVKERERERVTTTTASPKDAVVVPARPVSRAGAAPVLRSPPPSAPRAEPRRGDEATAPTRRGPRDDGPRRDPRDDDTVVRRPLR